MPFHPSPEGISRLSRRSTATGLVKKVIHSRQQTSLLLFLERAGSKGDDTYVLPARRFQLPDGSGGFQSVHFRHLNVHKNDIRLMLPEAVYRLKTIFGLVDDGFGQMGVQYSFEQNHIHSHILRQSGCSDRGHHAEIRVFWFHGTAFERVYDCGKPG